MTARAECLVHLGRQDEASELANAVLQIDNMNADAYFVQGLCLYYRDNLACALNHFTQVLRLKQDQEDAREDKKFISAVEFYKKAKSEYLKSLKSKFYGKFFGKNGMSLKKKKEGKTAFKFDLEETCACKLCRY